PSLRQHRAQDALDLVERGLVGDQRRRELDDRVAAVVGPAVQAVVVQRLGEEAVEDAFGLLLGEGEDVPFEARRALQRGGDPVGERRGAPGGVRGGGADVRADHLGRQHQLGPA
ncbi:hypothetical protein ADL26_18040, partial [Thermoactinomyces vulgaris]